MSIKLSKTKWDEGQGLKDLIFWGTEPIRALAQAIQTGETNDVFVKPIAYLIEDRIDEMDFAISNFMEKLKIDFPGPDAPN